VPAPAPKAFVIGHPIAHSRSPLIHGHWLAELGLAGSYERVDIRPDELSAFLLSFRDRGFVGGNVTIPHKEAVFQLVDETTDLARRLGAVNTIWTEPDGRIVGHNTDAAGFTAGLDEAVGPGWTSEVASALVLGAGGAARAIIAGLLDRGVGRIMVANRTPDRVHALRAFAPDRIELAGIDQVDALLGDTDLLVNTTPLGMKGQPDLAIELGRLRRGAIVADIVYVPLQTPLLAAACERGLRIADGLGMLLHQAVPGFHAWFGATPRVTSDLRNLIAADIERGS
jgi:shikimate dehydrogenase